MQTTTPTSIPAEELMFLGSRCRILATSESTDGTYGLVDMIEVAAGDMPPLHVHTHDEGFLLLEGELSLFLPDREIPLRPGEFVPAPRGIPHTYQVGDDSPARWLVVSTPAGFESFVEDVAGLDEVTPEALTATAAVHGIEILGPPGTMP